MCRRTYWIANKIWSHMECWGKMWMQDLYQFIYVTAISLTLSGVLDARILRLDLDFACCLTGRHENRFYYLLRTKLTLKRLLFFLFSVPFTRMDIHPGAVHSSMMLVSKQLWSDKRSKPYLMKPVKKPMVSVSMSKWLIPIKTTTQTLILFYWFFVLLYFFLICFFCFSPE